MTEVHPPEGKLNFSGIPTAQFIDNVDTFMAEVGQDNVNNKLKVFDEQLQKYRFMESSLMSKIRRLKAQTPDITSSLLMIKQLREKHAKDESTESQFFLSDQVYAKGIIPPTDKVCLWLGANVMLEYSLDEAEELLRSNKTSAEKMIAEATFDLDFLKDQMTITEVTIARLYNWDVVRRKGAKKSEAEEGSKK